ncbi:MAG: hypothetical protein ACRC92_27190 [Peptostreptococcaceae bacterium]
MNGELRYYRMSNEEINTRSEKLAESLASENDTVEAVYKNLIDAISVESAFNTNPNYLKNALIRTSMLFRLDKDKAVVAYAEVFKNLDVNSIKPGASDTILNRTNIEAYDSMMKIMGSFDISKMSKDIEGAIRCLENGQKTFFKKWLISMFMCGIPFMGLIGLLIIICELNKLNNSAVDMNVQYADALMNNVSNMLIKSELGKKLHLKLDASGRLPLESISAIITEINKIRNTMYPVSIKNMVRPNFLKPKNYLSHEDKVANVELLKKNTDFYLGALANGTMGKMDAARLLLAAPENSDGMKYGIAMDVGSVGSQYANLCLTFIISALETVDFTILLVQDLRRY